ncbi:MAG: glycosyltransferase family 2 protein [Cytophagaceae bacterium]|nr:glycosyltransferase family 2 protein [Cytophagaceae bacterium]MDW8457226.1 glycosyltransferase family 2 protein [Cytophagaceae bacterium]
MNSVAIVILNWNGRKYLEQFLPYVITHSQNAEIVIADNNSTDDSLSFLRLHYPSLRVIRISKNEGYSKGYNIALKQIEAEYYVLLNSDIEVTENWIEPVIAFMRANPDVAACQPKILSYHNRNAFEYAGACGGFIDYLGYPFCRGRIFNTLENDCGQYDKCLQIFWATGACMFVRAAAFHEVNGFDDDYFAHMEEIDLCWRLQHRGYKIFCIPQSRIYHIGGGTLNKLSPQKTYLNFRNSLYALYKNIESRYLFVIIFLRLCLDGVAGIKFLFTDSYKHSFAVVRAHLSFYRNVRKLHKQRVELKKKKKSCSLGLFQGSIVFHYFILGKKKYSDIFKNRS